MSNTFLPNHPKSILYSAHTLLYVIDLFVLFWARDFRYLILLGVRITMSWKQGKKG